MINGGTIPDRGLYGVFLAAGTAQAAGSASSTKRWSTSHAIGDVFALGSTSWQIVDITHDQVLVSPAPGRAGRLPFWHGDAVGRPAEFGSARSVHYSAPAVNHRRAGTRVAGRQRTRRPGRQQCVAYLKSRRSRAAHSPTTARSCRALPRRDRRLAPRDPLAVRWQGEHAVGDGARRAAA